MVPTPPLSPPHSLQANLFPAALVHFGAKEPAGEYRWLGPVLEPSQPVSGPQSQLPGRAFSLGPPLGLRGSSAAPITTSPREGWDSHLLATALPEPSADGQMLGRCWADGGWRMADGPPPQRLRVSLGLPAGVYLEPGLLEHAISPSAADMLVAR